MHLEEVRERSRERETRPGWWVEAARYEAAKRAGKGNNRPISQMRLATLAGRHVSAVARWEAHDGEIDYLSWVGLLHVLGLPLSWEPSAPPVKKPKKATTPH